MAGQLFHLLDDGSAVLMLLLAVLLATGPDRSDLGRRVLALAVAALGSCDLFQLHGRLAALLATGAGGHAAVALAKVAVLGWLAGSFAVLVLLLANRPLRVFLLGWLAALSLAGCISELGGLIFGGAATLSWGEEAAEVIVNAAACALVLAPRLVAPAELDRAAER